MTAAQIAVYAACRVAVPLDVRLQSQVNQRGEIEILATPPTWAARAYVIAPAGIEHCSGSTLDVLASSIATRLACKVGFLP